MEEPKLIETRVFPDTRGWFMESFNRDAVKAAGIDKDWMQDNVSKSYLGVIRGIHYQLDGQAKLVRCLRGKIVDVIVDLRENSSSKGAHYFYALDGDEARQLYVPPGFGHSFLAMTDSIVMYKVDKPWNKELERGIAYDDPELGIPWNTFIPGADFRVSSKDRELPSYQDADLNFQYGDE